MLKRFVVVLSLVLVTGCATGPALRDVQATLRPLTGDKARIYLYRDASPLGAAIQPTVFLNDGKGSGDVKIGSSIPGGVFFRDLAPGAYKVWVETEVEKSVAFDVAAGQTRYIRMEPGFGFLVGRIHLTLVDPTQGEHEIQGLSLVSEE